MKLNLTEFQTHWWIELTTIITKNNVNTSNQEHMQAAVKRLALDLIQKYGGENRVVIPYAEDKTLKIDSWGSEKSKKYEYKSKEDYLKKHEKASAWGDDIIMQSLLCCLGYQPIIETPKSEIPGYEPFEIPATGLKINLINHGAVKRGWHWELKGRRNPGRGKCLYYSIAQQVMQDYKAVCEALDIGLPRYNGSEPCALIPKQRTFGFSPNHGKPLFDLNKPMGEQHLNRFAFHDNNDHKTRRRGQNTGVFAAFDTGTPATVREKPQMTRSQWIRESSLTMTLSRYDIESLTTIANTLPKHCNCSNHFFGLKSALRFNSDDAYKTYLIKRLKDYVANDDAGFKLLLNHSKALADGTFVAEPQISTQANDMQVSPGT